MTGRLRSKGFFVGMVLGLGLGPAAVLAQADCAPLRLGVLTPPDAATPYVVLEAGGRTGPWLVDYGSTITSVYAEAWGTHAGEPFRLDDLRFPGIAAGPRWLPAVTGGSPRDGVGSPLGRLGTDVLANVTAAFYFEDAADPYMSVIDASCSDDMAAGPGLMRTDETNIFGQHPETHTSGLPNVPVLFIELAEVPTDAAPAGVQPSGPTEPKRSARVWAQLDSGYADTVRPFTVDINEPYLAALKESVPALTRVGEVRVAGCGEEDTLRDVYEAPGWRLEIIPDRPQAPVRVERFHFVVKPRGTGCGGIGPMPVPAAQLGASFLRAFGTTVISPSRSEMWIGRPGTK